MNHWGALLSDAGPFGQVIVTLRGTLSKTHVRVSWRGRRVMARFSERPAVERRYTTFTRAKLAFLLLPVLTTLAGDFTTFVDWHIQTRHIEVWVEIFQLQPQRMRRFAPETESEPGKVSRFRSEMLLWTLYDVFWQQYFNQKKCMKWLDWVGIILIQPAKSSEWDVLFWRLSGNGEKSRFVGEMHLSDSLECRKLVCTCLLDILRCSGGTYAAD